MLKAHLVLGCHGYKDEDGFLFCSGIHNPILDLSCLNEDYDKVKKFLDNACGLLDAPCYDYNKCVNIITMLYRNYKVIPETNLHKIQLFLKNHRQCGIFITIALKEYYER